jgi:hypothetical protein
MRAIQVRAQTDPNGPFEVVERDIPEPRRAENICRCVTARLLATPSPENSLLAAGDIVLRRKKGLAMTTSKMIAGLIGPTFIAIAAAIILNFGSFPALAEQISRDAGLILLSGILLFVAGLAIVRAHNIWAGGWPVLVTVLGWVAVLGGLVRMFFPIQLAAMAAGVGQSSGSIIAAAVVILVLGAFLSFKGYSRD